MQHRQHGAPLRRPAAPATRQANAAPPRRLSAAQSSQLTQSQDSAPPTPGAGSQTPGASPATPETLGSELQHALEGLLDGSPGAADAGNTIAGRQGRNTG